MPLPQTRVVLVGDDRLQALLAPCLDDDPSSELVGWAPDGADAAMLCATRAPDVVVIDMGLPDTAGGELIATIRDHLPTVAVVVVPGSPDRPEQAAVVGPGEADLLVQAIRRAGASTAASAALDAELPLTAAPASASRARAFTQRVLDGWGCDALVEDAQLVISELVTNAVRHAGSQVTLWLRLTAQSLRITVADEHQGSPRPLPFSMTRRHGRGLMVVSALATAWGVEPRPGGKAVWAELSR